MSRGEALALPCLEEEFSPSRRSSRGLAAQHLTGGRWWSLADAKALERLGGRAIIVTLDGGQLEGLNTFTAIEVRG